MSKKFVVIADRNDYDRDVVPVAVFDTKAAATSHAIQYNNDFKKYAAEVSDICESRKQWLYEEDDWSDLHEFEINCCSYSETNVIGCVADTIRRLYNKEVKDECLSILENTDIPFRERLLRIKELEKKHPIYYHDKLIEGASFITETHLEAAKAIEYIPFHDKLDLFYDYDFRVEGPVEYYEG